MKTAVTLLASVIFWMAPAIASDTPIRDKWALVIGISKFQNQNLNLQYADKDAQDFVKFLTTKGKFAPDHVQVLLNEQATRQNILDYLGDKWLPRVALPEDLVVIFISSHGTPSHADVAGANYLVAHDTNPDHLFSTGVSMGELASIIKERVHSNRVVLVLDACHSGSAKPSESKDIVRKNNFDAQTLMQGSGQLVICSSDSSQVSWESKKYPNGVFTHHLIESLQREGDSTRLGEAFEDLKEKVQVEVLADRGELQTPVMRSKWQGADLALLAPPTKPRPAIQVSLTETTAKPPPVTAVPPSVSKLTQLAASKMQSGNFAEALTLYESLRETLESTIGRDTKETAECLTQLGWLYLVHKRVDDAESLQRESVRVNETVYGPKSFFVARELTLLCNTLLAERKFAEAEPIAMRAISSWQALGGEDNPNVLESLVNLAAIREHSQNFTDAKKLLDHAERIADASKLAATDPHRLKLQNAQNSLRSAIKGR